MRVYVYNVHCFTIKFISLLGSTLLFVRYVCLYIQDELELAKSPCLGLLFLISSNAEETYQFML